MVDQKHSIQVASFPGPRPASRRLQYGHCKRRKAGPGNEATKISGCPTPSKGILNEWILFSSDKHGLSGLKALVCIPLYIKTKSFLHDFVITKKVGNII